MLSFFLMQPYDMFPFMNDPSISSETMGPIIAVIVILVVLEMILKGFALWRAARMGLTGWFVALLIVNTGGLFSILFLVFTNARYKEFTEVPKPITVKKKRKTRKA